MTVCLFLRARGYEFFLNHIFIFHVVSWSNLVPGKWHADVFDCSSNHLYYVEMEKNRIGINRWVNLLQRVLALCDFWAWEEVALPKYLAYAFFGLFTSLLRFFVYFWPKNRSNEINSPKIASAKYKNRSNEIISPKNA